MKLFEKIFGTHSENELKRIYPIADRIEAMEADMQKLSDDELKNKTNHLYETYIQELNKKSYNKIVYQYQTNRL